MPSMHSGKESDLKYIFRDAGIAQLVEHNLAKVGVAGSSPVSRSRKHTDAGWSSLVARRAHNPEVVGSNPTPATEAVRRSGGGRPPA